MSVQIEYWLNKAVPTEIVEHLLCCDADFVSVLCKRVELNAYANKIVNKALRFEAWVDGVLVGLVAAYCNDSERCMSFITSVSILPTWQGKGIAAQLMERCIHHVRQQGFACVELEVDNENVSAVKLYENKGFTIKKRDGQTTIMRLNIDKGHL